MAIMINDEWEVEAHQLVLAERTRANAVHPHYPDDPVRRVGIITEENGEAMQAALDLTRRGDHAHHDLENARSRLLSETVQTAAAAFNMVVNMLKEGE